MEEIGKPVESSEIAVTDSFLWESFRGKPTVFGFSKFTGKLCYTVEKSMWDGFGFTLRTYPREERLGTYRTQEDAFREAELDFRRREGWFWRIFRCK